MANQVLIKVATKFGHAVFRLDDVLTIADSHAGGCFIDLTPTLGCSRFIESVWHAEQVLRVIEEALRGG